MLQCENKILAFFVKKSFFNDIKEIGFKKRRKSIESVFFCDMIEL